MLQSVLKHVLLLSLLLYNGICCSQNGNESILQWFDQSGGRENIAAFNGPAYINAYKLDVTSHPYLEKDEYSTGCIHYDDQQWCNLNLMYDIHRDIVILKSEGAYSYIGISLIREKTMGFTLYGKNFVNLKLQKVNAPPLIESGYYEQISIGNHAVLYVKHYKHRRDIIRAGRMFDSFTDQNQFIIFENNEFTPINAKKEIIGKFPQHRQVINDFYKLHRKASKTKQIEFTTDLLRHIYNRDQVQAK